MRESWRVLLGMAASGAVALAGWRKGALSPSGAAGAVGVGTAVVGAGGLAWSGPLFTFFALSSALSFAGRSRKRSLDEVAAKGARRDVGQVLANGGVGAMLALSRPLASKRSAVFAAYLGAMSAVTADTWATEIGALSRRPPRSIVSGRVVRVGVSGGVTALGLGGAVAGGAVIGLVGAATTPASKEFDGTNALGLIGVAALAGLVGSLADSLLGATLQQTYWCPSCDVETEQVIHRCGAASLPLRGLGFINNDVVNACCSLSGALVGALASRRLVS